MYLNAVMILFLASGNNVLVSPCDGGEAVRVVVGNGKGGTVVAYIG